MTRKAVDRRRKSTRYACVGIDEVGRGPLAGPMVIAGVADIPARLLAGIRDSKQLTPKAREVWYRAIKKAGTARYVVLSARLIDERGISYAARTGIDRLLKKFDSSVALTLLDGGLYAPPRYAQKTIIKGDEREPLIAAASIIAKVTRDRMMVRMHSRFPQYDFPAHKGYGTAAHCAAIREYGLSDIHRRTFCARLVRAS